MKCLWTTAAMAALLAMTAGGPAAAQETKKKSQAEVARTLRDADSPKKKAAAPAAKGKRAAPVAEADKKKKATAPAQGKRAAAKAEAEKKPGASRTKRAAADEAETAPKKKGAADPKKKLAAAAEVPARGPVAKGPIKTEAPAPVKVTKGDTLDRLAKRAGVDRQVLIDANNLKPPYALKPGQSLKLPERRYYSVQSGDTLYAVSRRFKVAPDELAAFNDTDLKKRVKIGERIYLPGAAGEAAKPAKPTKLAKAEPKPAKPSATEVAAAGATTRSRSAPPAKPAAQPAPTPAAPTTRLALAPAPARPVVVPPPAAAPAPAPSPDDLSAETGLQPLPAETGLQPPVDASAGLAPPLAAETGLPARSVAAAAPAPAPAAAPAAASPPPVAAAVAQAPRPAPTAPPPAAPATLMAAATVQPPSVLRPQPSAPPVRAPAPQRLAVAPAPRSGFEMAPASPPLAAPSGGVPYTILRQPTPGPTGGRGRPAALPPSIAREAPSSQPQILAMTTTPPTRAEIAAAGRGRFIWPVRGEVLSAFGPKAAGDRNDGLNISAKPGEAVRAAAAGKVVYAGDQVPTFGNLVLVEHANGWVTAYAHLSGILVKNNDMVAQGQQIGVAGNSGNVAQAQVHFETRYRPTPRDKASPIDPMLVLPGG